MTFMESAAGCGGFVQPAGLAPRACQAAPEFVGLKMYRQDSGRRHVVRGFACAGHVEHFDVARPLRDADRALLERRRERQRVELSGRRWDGEREGPLAWGREADELLERARAWVVARK